jgi:hypothetical protein
MGFKDLFRRNAIPLRPTRVEFLREQDGEFERDLKARLLPVLRQHDGIRRAYLALIGYEPQAKRQVALCLRTSEDAPRILADRLGAIFQSLAGAELSLDILFVDSEQESDLRRVAAPFYTRAA